MKKPSVDGVMPAANPQAIAQAAISKWVLSEKGVVTIIVRISSCIRYMFVDDSPQ